MLNKGQEYEMFELFDMTPDLVCIASKEGYFKRVNQSVINKLEYTQDELFASPIATFIHPDDKIETSRTRSELLKGKALLNFQNRYITKTGKIVWFQWTSIYIPDKEIVFAIAKDVTEKKINELEIEEKYLRFKSLASHFKSKMELDKKYIADELHEELAQLATVVKMDIEWIKNNAVDLSSSSQERVDHALTLSQLLIDAIRRISYSISPNMLYDLGLSETLKWLCNEFTLVNGISCQCECKYDTDTLSPEIQLDFFRICQEALSNIVIHSQASKLKITIQPKDNGVCLCIEDNGKGIDVEQTEHVTVLSKIQKRASSINAVVNVISNTKGTKICINMPA